MKLTAILFALATLTGCAKMTVQEYANTEIKFNPFQFFNNDLVAEGIVRDRSGKVSRTFTAEIKAQWDENGGVLDEVFQWSDGEVQTRVWQFEKQADGRYVGRAGDVVGEATMDYAGNAINMKYVLQVPLKSGNTIDIKMDDWLFQTSENTLVNVTRMSKFGFGVGEVVLTMRVND